MLNGRLCDLSVTGRTAADHRNQTRCQISAKDALRCVCVCVCVSTAPGVCVCVSVCTDVSRPEALIYMISALLTSVWVCVCVCVCVCAQTCQDQRLWYTWSQHFWRVCVCVCVCVCVVKETLPLHLCNSTFTHTPFFFPRIVWDAPHTRYRTAWH